ncbi:hypothetical protein AVEN_130613-1 [Araneus ventricosus]|uniref:Uncharacterized protein n=1 Tax=Araneus ventricosus TaxID=182803 RepID=A0A4Y2RRV5_ARAVE|nr:hypothetical protein AVEN_130613-1 [Araneus ventricosus]
MSDSSDGWTLRVSLSSSSSILFCLKESFKKSSLDRCPSPKEDWSLFAAIFSETELFFDDEYVLGVAGEVLDAIGLTASPTTEPNKGWQLPALDFPASALAMMLAGTYTLGVTPGTVTILNAKPKE